MGLTFPGILCPHQDVAIVAFRCANNFGHTVDPSVAQLQNRKADSFHLSLVRLLAILL